MSISKSLRRFLRRLFLENMGLKILSLFIGFSMWFFISSEQSIEKIIEIPVEVINKPADLEIANDYTKSVLVQVEARQYEEGGIAKNLVATVDLQSAHAGENVIPLQEQDVRAPSNVKVMSIRPSTITLILEPLISKTVPITVRYSGQPAENYHVTGTQAVPPTVTISGPSSHVRSVNEIVTQTIDITNRSSNVAQLVNLIAENNYITLNIKERIQAVVDISERMVARTFRGVPIKVLNTEDRYRLRPRTATVHLEVVISKKDVITAADLELSVDATAVPDDRTEQEIPVNFRVINPDLTAGVTIDKIVPNAVSLRLYRKK